MATVTKNTLTIYLDTEITRDKNREIDDIETFLNQTGHQHYSRKYVYEDIQYFKHGLHRTIKIDTQQTSPTQDYLGNVGFTNIDYVSIQNKLVDAYPIYYFVDEKRWISQKCIELVLTQDTINSHKNEYTLSKKSLIERQHGNRYKRINDGNANFWREVDIVPEGLNLSLFNTSNPKEPNYILQDGQAPDTHYYLMFKAQQDITQIVSNPVDMYIVDNKGLLYEMGTGAYNASIDGNDMNGYWNPPNNYFAIIVEDGTETEYDVEIETVGGQIIHTKYKVDVMSPYTTQEGPVIFQIELPSSGNPFQFNVYKIKYKGTIEDWGYDGVRTIEAVDAVRITFSGQDTFKIKLKNYDSTYPSDPTKVPSFYDWQSNIHNTTKKTVTAGQPSGHRTIPLNELNRTDSKIIRIIELPYSPFQTNRAGDTQVYYLDPTYFELEEQGTNTGKYLIKVKNLWTKAVFRNVIPSAYDPISLLDQRPTVSDLIKTKLRDTNDKFESKLLHSDFYMPKFVYDSFAYPIMLERVDKLRYVWDSNKTFNIKFIPTTTMNSRFLFYFQDYNTKGLGYEDYPAYLNVSRNNEVSLYTNAYLDYLRTGYNYDVKAKERQQTSNWVNFGGSVLGTIGAGVATYYSGGAAAPFLISGAGSMLTSGYNAVSQGGTPDFLKGSILGEVMSSIAGTGAIEDAFQKKLAELRSQAGNVAGADDIDLMEEYSSNKLKYVIYELSEQTRKNVANLFYYCGYKRGRQGLPNKTSRIWFNFIQADIVFESTSNMSDEILNDIIARYKEGLTVMHHNYVTIDGSSYDEYDWEQKYENWETIFWS